MKRGTILTLVIVAGLWVAPAFGQTTLQAHQSLTWDTPYPSSKTVCGSDSCCEAPEVWYRLEWTLAGVPFGGNAQDFALLYPPWPVWTGCAREVRHVYPVKYYSIQPGTLVRLALYGVNAAGKSPRSNVVEVYWPWVCEGTTTEEFGNCALDCAATMGVAWCEGGRGSRFSDRLQRWLQASTERSSSH